MSGRKIIDGLHEAISHARGSQKMNATDLSTTMPVSRERAIEARLASVQEHLVAAASCLADTRDWYLELRPKVDKLEAQVATLEAKIGGAHDRLDVVDALLADLLTAADSDTNTSKSSQPRCSR